MGQAAEQLAFTPIAAGWRWVVGSGLMLLVAGLAAFAEPTLALTTASVFIGWLLIVAGALGTVAAMRARRHGGQLAETLYGVVSILVGVFILFNPRDGAMSLTLALAIWLAVRGAIDVARAVRAGPLRPRVPLAGLGIVNIVLAAALLGAYPFPAVRAVGLFLGISFALAGAVTIATGLRLRRIAE